MSILPSLLKSPKLAPSAQKCGVSCLRVHSPVSGGGVVDLAKTATGKEKRRERATRFMERQSSKEEESLRVGNGRKLPWWIRDVLRGRRVYLTTVEHRGLHRGTQRKASARLCVPLWLKRSVQQPLSVICAPN